VFTGNAIDKGKKASFFYSIFTVQHTKVSRESFL